MNKTLMAAVAAALAMLLPTQAFAACKVIKPKTWAGTVQLANHASVSRQDWDTNNCKFRDARLNGFDARAFDVYSHRGLAASAKWTTSNATKPGHVAGIFYTSACAPIPMKGFTQFKAGAVSKFAIPTTAKWLIVQPGTIVPSKDIAVTVSSPGRTCR